MSGESGVAAREGAVAHGGGTTGGRPRGLRRHLEAPLFTPRGLLLWAAAFSLLFGVAHLAGLRRYLSVISLTVPEGASLQEANFYAAVYLILYLLFTLVVPVLVVAAGLLGVKEWLGRRRGRGGASPAVLAVLAAGAAAGAGGPGALGAQTLPVAEIDRAVAAGLPAALATYRELLSLPNDAHFPDDIERLVAWLEDAFRARGFGTERLPTAGSPLLLAERRHPGARRTVLVYLQADGQPVDPSAWDQADPFTPVVKERAADGGWRPVAWERVLSAAEAVARAAEREAGTALGEADLRARGLEPGWRVFARSAADSKGPIAQLLAALDAAERAGVVPDAHLKVIVDTEEEQGSPHLPEAVERLRERLAADMLVIFDGPPHVSGRPTLKFGARGIATVTLTAYGPRVPVHSGHYGNYAPNPALHLAELLATLKDEDGRVVIPGWYDGVELDAETRRILDAVPDDEPEIRRELGIAAIDDVGTTLQEAVQYPSLNVRGLRAGWVGDEVRTIIPATAVAEIDVRLVAESDPERLLRLLREHVEAQGFAVLDDEPTEEERMGLRRKVRFESDVSYAAFRTPFDSEPGRWLAAALRHLHGSEPIRIRTSGGSIPISPFVSTLGVPAVSVPTVNADNNQHSPNENLRVGSFVEGIRTMLAVLQQELPRP